MSGTCIYCGFSGTNDMMENHAGNCPVWLSEGKLIYKNGKVMMEQRIRPLSDQNIGGTLTIPEGYCVENVDLDSDVPTCTISKYDTENGTTTQILEIPRALAYYLTTHHNGSIKFRDSLRSDAQNTLRSKIKNLLEYSEKNIEF